MTACGTNPIDNINSDSQSRNEDTATFLPDLVSTESSFPEDTGDYSYATFFVVIADTSPDYYLLHKKMFEINSKRNIPIDTMGRFYNKAKNLIALPDNDEDEMYAGDYLPRRFPSESLSLEYLDVYQSNAGEKTIALVSGIYESETDADSAWMDLQKTMNNAFKIKANMYVGCMH